MAGVSDTPHVLPQISQPHLVACFSPATSLEAVADAYDYITVESGDWLFL